MIKVISLNPDPIYLVVSRCLKSQYQRNSIVNFLKATGGMAATAVIVRYDSRFVFIKHTSFNADKRR